MATRQGNLRDDPDIPPDAILWRRVNRDDKYQIKKGRPTSPAFNRHKAKDVIREYNIDEPAISVCIADTAIENGLTSRDVAKGEYLVKITAEEVRNLGLGIVRTPLPDDPGHADIFDLQNRSKTKFKEVQRALAKACEWEIGPVPEP